MEIVRNRKFGRAARKTDAAIFMPSDFPSGSLTVSNFEKDRWGYYFPPSLEYPIRGRQLKIAKTWAQRMLRERCRKIDDCIEWMGPFESNGYGRQTYKSISILIHRLAYLFHYGHLTSGLLICHKCDNKRCVKKDHLFEGTYADNNRDMLSKGRGRWQKRLRPQPEGAR